MVLSNLNQLLKTVLVGNAKLPTPADRVGSGYVDDIGHDPATFLSQGQFPLPRLPEPEPRSRQEVTDAMSMSPAAAPVGPTGSVSGASASRRPDTSRAILVVAKPTTPRALTGVTASTTVAGFGSLAGAGRASFPGSVTRVRRIGRDCQSPDRRPGYQADHAHCPPSWRRWDRRATPAAAAAK